MRCQVRRSGGSSKHIRPGDAGFTLAELLIVVAIILVLVAVALPVFTGALNEAQEATCEANRRSLKSAYAVAYEMAPTADPEMLLSRAVATCDTDLEGAGMCPAGGVYTFSATEGVLTVICSEHGGGTDESAWTTMYGVYEEWLARVDNPYRLNTNYVSDNQARESYAEVASEWATVTDAAGDSYYLEFKSYNNRSTGLFWYASVGGTSSIDDHGTWAAKYIRATDGRWYELPETKGVSRLNESSYHELIEGGTEVDLACIDGSYVFTSS